MDEPLRIFVADYWVPLANKGEEAIIRGIEDLLGDNRKPVELAVFDRQVTPTVRGNIKVFPVSWAYPDQTRRFGTECNRLLRSFEARCQRWRERWRKIKQWFGLLGTLNNIARSNDPEHRQMREFFNEADYILVGHDGVFNYETCGILQAAKRAGKKAGVLGAGGPWLRPQKGLVASLYRRAVNEADFFVLRERGSYEGLVETGCDASKLVLAPDPAFAMKPAARKDVDAFLSKLPLYQRAREQEKLVIAVTVAHKRCLLNTLFRQGQTKEEKIRLHSMYLSEVYDRVLASIDACLLFLPHSLEPWPRNDMEAARGVVELMRTSKESYHVVEGDLSARLLKGIIGECDFLIGQRAHSLIGSASVGTPYVALTASDDSRTHDILGDMCGCEQQMIDMDRYGPDAAAASIVGAIDRRASIQAHLVQKIQQFHDMLRQVKALIEG